MGDAGPPGGLNGVLDSADEAIRAATPAAAAISAKRPTVTSATRHATCGACGTVLGDRPLDARLVRRVVTCYTPGWPAAPPWYHDEAHGWEQYAFRRGERVIAGKRRDE